MIQHSKEILEAYTHWVGVRPTGFKGEYCDSLNDLYNSGKLIDLYTTTQHLFKEQGIQEVEAWRVVTGYEESRILVPFAINTSDAKEYTRLRKGCNQILHMYLPVKHIIFNTFFFEDYFEDYIDELLGFVPGLEYICINKMGIDWKNTTKYNGEICFRRS